MAKKFIGRDGRVKGTVVKGRSGGEFLLLNPSGRAGKYAHELKTNTKITNEGVVKKGAGGVPMALTKDEATYRMGYLAARSDNAKAYKHNRKKGR